MAISTYKTFLMQKKETKWEKLIDIKDYPDLGGPPEMLETTTLSDMMKTFIEGIQENGALEFTLNYTKAEYANLKQLKGQTLELAVWFGGTESGATVTPTGADGKLSFSGTLSVYLPGKGTNNVVEMIISIAPSTSITFEEE